jgi:small conductance mechanosensitive channel
MPAATGAPTSLFPHALLLVPLLAASMALAAPAAAQAPASDVATAAATPNPRQVQAEARAGAREDSRMASAVAALLLRQPALAAVTVEVHAGIVTLAGKVPEEPDRTRAATLAKQVRGVTEVVNAIELDASLHTRFDSAVDQVKGKFVRLIAATPLLVAALAIVLLAIWFGRWLAGRTPWRLRSRNPYMDGLVRRTVQTLVVLVGVLVALDLLGATALVGAVLGSAGVVGLILGFGFRDIAENYIAGVLLSLRRPFAPGDHLLVDKYEGKVVALTSRTTLLMTLDGNRLSLPNALVFKSVVLNYSVNPKRRFDFVLPIDPTESIRRARELAIEAIAKVDGVLSDPAPSWSAEGYTAKGIDLRFYGWIDQRQSDPAKVRSEALRAVKGAFGRAGVHGPETVRYLPPEPPAALREPSRQVPAGDEACGDTSVNRDIDAQLAAAQRATDERNLLDTTAKPNGGGGAARS